MFNGSMFVSDRKKLLFICTVPQNTDDNKIEAGKKNSHKWNCEIMSKEAISQKTINREHFNFISFYTYPYGLLFLVLIPFGRFFSV
jgi:hypothetical protein